VEEQNRNSCSRSVCVCVCECMTQIYVYGPDVAFCKYNEEQMHCIKCESFLEADSVHYIVKLRINGLWIQWITSF
jgi:hypothetical protein